MLTLNELREKGYEVEVNTTGAMIVDTVKPSDIPISEIDSNYDVEYVQKEIIYDDIETSYDLVRISDGSVVYSSDSLSEFSNTINNLLGGK